MKGFQRLACTGKKVRCIVGKPGPDRARCHIRTIGLRIMQPSDEHGLQVAVLNTGKWGYHPSKNQPDRPAKEDQDGPGGEMPPFPG